jgi:hypothetical protein
VVKVKNQIVDKVESIADDNQGKLVTELGFLDGIKKNVMFVSFIAYLNSNPGLLPSKSS